MQSMLFVELLGGIGDVLIALPAIQALGRSHPTAKLTVLTFSPGGELLRGDPTLHRVACVERDDGQDPHRTRRSVDEFLSRHTFDLIVSDTTYDGIDDVIQRCGARRVVTNLWRQPPPDERVGGRFLRILLAEGVIEPEAVAEPRLFLTLAERQAAQEALGAVSPPVVFLFPDAGMAIKRWPLARFVSLGQALRRRYGATIVVPEGSPAADAAGLAAAIGGTARRWPSVSLRRLAAGLACAHLVVAADTGVARIAAAVGVPTITLFGPSWHGRYGPPPPHVNVQGYAACSLRVVENFTQQACWYSGVCPLQWWRTCLEDIAPADVLAVAASLLSASSVSSVSPGHAPPMGSLGACDDASGPQPS